MFGFGKKTVPLTVAPIASSEAVLQDEGCSIAVHEAHKFVALFQHMREGVAIHTVIRSEHGDITNYRLVEANPAFTTHTGILYDQIMGKLATEAYGVDKPPYLDIYARVLQTQKTESFQSYFEPLNRSFSISAVPLSETSFATIFTDITEEQAKQKRSEEDKERLQIIFESAPDAMYLHERDGTFVDGNRASETLTGYQRSELIGKNFLTQGLLRGNDLVKAAEEMAASLMGKTTGPTEYTLWRKDGTAKVALISSFPVVIGDKKLVLGTARDVSDQLQAQMELKKFKQGIERSNDVVFMTDKDGYFTYVNFAFVDLYGYDLAEIAKQTPRILKSGKQTGEFYREFWETLTRGSVVSTKITNRTKSGNLVTMRVTASPIINDAQQIDGFLAIQRNVTADEEAEAALARRAAELEQMNKAMIGRELKMVDLKKEIETLKEKLP